MLIQAVSQTSPYAIYILSGNDDINVALGVTLFTTGSVDFPTSSDAILAFSGHHRITVAGTILAFDDCINPGYSPNRVFGSEQGVSVV